MQIDPANAIARLARYYANYTLWFRRGRPAIAKPPHSACRAMAPSQAAKPGDGGQPLQSFTAIATPAGWTAALSLGPHRSPSPFPIAIPKPVPSRAGDCRQSRRSEPPPGRTMAGFGRPGRSPSVAGLLNNRLHLFKIRACGLDGRPDRALGRTPAAKRLWQLARDRAVPKIPSRAQSSHSSWYEIPFDRRLESILKTCL